MIDSPKLVLPDRVFWNWDIHYSCNYRCSYCFLAGKWENAAKGNRYPGINRWIEVWGGIYEKYGSCHIHFSGGEPFIYPDFLNLIVELSKKHTLEFSTNLSFNVLEFISKIKPSRAKFATAFHPEFADLNTYLEKVLQLRQSGFPISITYVAYPLHLETMRKVKAECDKKQITFIVQPFRGSFQGRNYPGDYTKLETDIINECSDNFPGKELLLNFHLKKKSNPHSVLCRMGQMYAKIYACADVYRCELTDGLKLGNLLDNQDFRLLDKPNPCEKFPCNYCDGWRAMLVGKEGEWLEHW